MTDAVEDVQDMVLVPSSAIFRRTNRATEKVRDVYFIQAETLGLIKIGVATDIQSRLRSLQASCPDRLVVLGLLTCHNFGQQEREVHARFADARAHGEWFRPTVELLDFIRNYAETNVRRVRVCQRDIDLWLAGSSRRLTAREMRIRSRL